MRVGYEYGRRAEVLQTIEKAFSNATRGIEEYLMIQDLHAANFRCFKQLELRGLKRINIVVGRNASGKTAFLETLKLGLDGTPSALPFLNQWRTIPFVFTANQTPEQFRALFSDFFHAFDCDNPIEINCVDSANRSSKLRLFFDPARAVTAQPSLGFQGSRPVVPTSTIVPLAFERIDFQNQKSILLATINQQGQPFLQPGKQLGIVAGFISSAYFGSQENATWLSQLSVAKRSDEVLESFRRHFPFIRNITPETVTPGIPATLYADLSNLPRKIPLSLVSGGISRLFTLMLAIVAFKGGVVLIDELENGIFYDQYGAVWKTMTDLAKHNDTQLFVSTHSKECLKEAMPVIAENPDDFSLLRIRREKEQSTMEVFGGAQVEAALEKNGEVRD